MEPVSHNAVVLIPHTGNLIRGLHADDLVKYGGNIWQDTPTTGSAGPEPGVEVVSLKAGKQE